MSAQRFYRWGVVRRQSMADHQCLGVVGNKRCQKPPEGVVVNDKMNSVGNYCEQCGRRLIALAQNRKSPHRAAHSPRSN